MMMSIRRIAFVRTRSYAARTAMCGVIAVGAVACNQQDAPTPPTAEQATGVSTQAVLDGLRRYAPGRLIVKYRGSAASAATSSAENGSAGTASPRLRALHRRHRFRAMRKLLRAGARRAKRAAVGHRGVDRIYRLDFDTNVDMKQMAEEYQKDPSVEYAHPDYVLELAAVPNDPRYSEQWAHQNIHSEAGWDRHTGSSGAVIAVIDTGVDWNHPDLQANIWTNPGETAGNSIDDDDNGFVDDVRGWDWVDVTQASSFDPGEDIGPPDNDPMDFLGHGTVVAGVAAARGNNATGVAGVCWNCSIMPLRAGVTQRELEVIGGRAYVLSSWTSAAVRYAADNGADVINLSLRDPNWPGALKDAIDYAYDRDVVIVGAAGNNSAGWPSYPAASDKVIGVAATDRSDQRAIWGVADPPLVGPSGSNFGTWVSVAAPGTSLLSTDFDNAYSSQSGTSLACGFVSGLAGLIRSAHPSFTHEQVRQVIESTTDRVSSDEYIGTGLINVDRALSITAVPTAEITAPVDDQTIGGSSITVSGSAGGSGFSSYTLRYGQGLYPASWSTITSGSSAVSNGTLGTWNLSSLTDNRAYTLQLRVTDGAGNTSLSEVLVYLQRDVQAGWPQVVNDFITGEGMVVGNIDPNDSTLEIAVVGKRSLGGPNNTHDLHVFKHDGSAALGWPVVDLNRELGSPTLADVTGDGRLEVIVGGTTWGYPNSTITFHVFSRTGAYLPGWPVTFTDRYEQRTGTPSVGDLDGDGHVEILFPIRTSSQGGPDADARLYVYHHDGTPMSGWPKHINLNFPEQTSSAQTSMTHATLADLDGNGDLEIVAGVGRYQATQLYVFQHDGTVATGWPKTLPDGRTPHSVVGDIDKDGRLEIVAVSNTHAHAWEADGTLMSGWPKANLPGAGPPMLGDLDGDEDLEIVFFTHNNDEIYAYHHTGAVVTNWPVTPDIHAAGSWPSGLIIDVTGDGQPEVVYPSGDESRIYAWHGNGNRVSGWPKELSDNATMAPAAADVNDDGNLDLVIASNDNVFLLDVGHPVLGMHWPMCWADGRHSGLHTFSDSQPGDLSADGDVDIVDMQLMVNVILEVETDATIAARADMDGSGAVTPVDLQRLINILIGAS